jgi:hypothetical protein
MGDVFSDELGWVLAIIFAVVFAVSVLVAAYFLWRAN